MDDIKRRKAEEEDDRKGMLLSLSTHVLLLALFYFMPSSGALKIPEKAPIVVELPQDMLGGGPALGLPDQGQGDKPSPGKPDPNAGGAKPDPAPAPREPEPRPTPTPPPPVKPVIAKPTAPAAPARKVETTEDPNAVALRRQQEETRKKNEEEKYRQASADRAKRQADEAETNRKAEAAAQAAAQQAAKDKFKGKFGNGTGSNGGNSGGGNTGGGLGNSGKPGSGGKPDGDPNSDRLDGLGRGPGKVDGFGGRNVKNAPRLQESSQKQGTVVLSVCVDADGSVISANYKAVGSSTNDADLIEAAQRNARQYKFASGSTDKQCGTITYRFIVK